MRSRKTNSAPSQVESRQPGLQGLAAELQGCKRCTLCENRSRLVYGEGSPTARLVFVGDAPGEEEDRSGRPFVGPSGQLLDKMIEAIGLSRSEVYLCNIVKCRPPADRAPEPQEVAACMPHLLAQLDAIRPAVVVALGNFATRSLLQTEEPLSSLRGQMQDWRGMKLMPTLHPSDLLRNPESKRDAWSDLRQVAQTLGITIPSLRNPKQR